MVFFCIMILRTPSATLNDTLYPYTTHIQSALRPGRAELARGKEMVDIVDAATRSMMIAGIRGNDTGPEVTLRRAMHARGFRYRLHVRSMPGRPDLVFPRYKAVVFVHGC